MLWNAARQGDQDAQHAVAEWLAFDGWPPGVEATNTGRRGAKPAFSDALCRALGTFGEIGPGRWLKARYGDLSMSDQGLVWRLGGRRTIQVGERVDALRSLIMRDRTQAPDPHEPLLAGPPSIFTVRRAVARGRALLRAAALGKVNHVEEAL